MAKKQPKTEQEKYKGRAGPERVQQIMREQGVSEARAKAIARGHGTTEEHGSVDVTPYPDRLVNETRSGQRAKSLLVGAARNDAKVIVEVFDKHHPTTPLLVVMPGNDKLKISARWLLYDKSNPERVGGEANLKKWLAKLGLRDNAEKDYVYVPVGITRIRITVFREQAQAA